MIEECLKEADEFVDQTEKVACFLACIQRRVGPGLRLVVTGGFAVELYTGAAYRTMDVDLIPEGKRDILDTLEKELERVAEKPAREWLLRGILKAIDLLPPSNIRDVITIITPCGELYVEAPEKVLVRYLCSWKFWESSEDRDKALALAYALEDLLDWKKVEDLAKKEGVEDVLKRLREWLRSLSKNSRRGG